jgi:CRP-like cAMP-binding protein
MDVKDLVGIPLFDGLSTHERAVVAGLADDIDVPAGTHLLEANAFPHEFFVLLRGEVEVRRDGAVLARLGPGDFFGEIAIIEDGVRTATVVAATPCRVAVMTTQAFATMRADMPHVAQTLSDAAAARLRS